MQAMPEDTSRITGYDYPIQTALRRKYREDNQRERGILRGEYDLPDQSVVGKDDSLSARDHKFFECEGRDYRYWDIDAERNCARGHKFKFMDTYPIGVYVRIEP